MKTMKHYILLSAVAVSGLLAASCNTLDQRSESVYDEQLVYSNETLARYALNSAYQAYGQMTSYRTDLPYYYGVNTDVEVRDYADNEKNNIVSKYDANATWSTWNNPASNYLYTGNFVGIEKCNLCISGLKKYGDIDNNPKMAAIYAEAICLRSLLMTTLMNVYGEIPARFEPVQESTIYLPKSDKDYLYKHILEDLEEAIRYLPTFDKSMPTVNPGRGCAEALYARLVLYSCGYSQRPDEGKVNTGDPGTVRKSTDPYFDTAVLYPKALGYLKDLIDNGGYKLYDDFKQIWKDMCSQNNVDYGKETIWCLPLSQQRGEWMIANAIPDPVNACTGTNGGNHRLSPALFFRYEPYDVRRDITCQPYKYDSKGLPSSLGSTTWYIGKYRFEWMGDHPLPKKGGQCGVKAVYLRLADAYLMASEIENELGHLPEAKDFMKPVLMRAYANDVDKVNAYLDKQADKAKFLQAIKDQRAFEFAGELLRRRDLIRWGELTKAIDEDRDRLKAMKTFKGTEYETKYNDKIYYRSNGRDYEFYGLNPGEKDVKSGDGWTSKTWFTGLDAKSYELTYKNDPDTKMWRPIPQSIINASNGTLKNDYGY